MNLLVLTCLLCLVVCSALGTQGSEAKVSSEPSGVTRAPVGSASTEGLQSSQGGDEELEIDEEHLVEHFSHELYPSRDERKKKKSKGKKRNKHKSKSTTPLNPEHSFSTSGYTSAVSTTEDPCTSTHLGYCIHGYCKYLEGLQEPVCICMKGYSGERCGIQSLETVKNQSDESSHTELVQTVLVIIAVVLSVISCIAILLMTCAHYRSQKNILASYLGTAAEQEKLQKPTADVVV